MAQLKKTVLHPQSVCPYLAQSFTLGWRMLPDHCWHMWEGLEDSNSLVQERHVVPESKETQKPTLL